MTGDLGAAAKPLKLTAVDGDDLVMLASLLQDAVVAVGDMAYLKDERCFALVAARFRWEADRGRPRPADAPAGERTNCGLRIDGVRAAVLRGIDRGRRTATLELSTLTHQDGALLLVFAGGAMVRLEVDAILCHLEDFGAPWPTMFRPDHGLDAAGRG